MNIDLPTQYECVICRRLICENYRRCSGELAALLERTSVRYVRRPERDGVRP